MRIRPDTAGFRAEADAGIKAALAGENPKVIVEAKTAAAKAQVAELRTYIDTLAARVSKFRLIAEDKELQAQLTRAALQLGKLGKTVANPKIRLEGATKATADVLGLDAALDKIAAKLATAHVALDEGNTEGRLGLLEAQLTTLTTRTREIRLGISDPAGLMVLDELQKRINELHSRVLSVGFLETSGNAGDAMRQVLQLKRIMQTAGLADFLDINMKPAQIIGQLTLLRQRIRAANLSDTLAVNVDTGSILKQIAALEGTLQGIPDQTVSLSLLGLGGVEAQVAQLRASMDELTQSEMAAAAAGGRFRGGIGGWIGALRTAIPVFDGMLPGILASIGAWHLLTDVVLEFAAVLIPAIVGVIAFGAAAIPTVQDIAKQMQNINTVTQATGKSLYPLTGSFQKIADAVQPQVYQLFGDALTIMNAKTNEFQKLATGAGHALDQLAARATSALLSGGFSQFLRNTEADIMGLGTVVGNIFGTIGNLLKTLPGYANYILNFFVTVTHGLEIFTGTGFFQGIAKAGLGLHGAFVYAGLGVTIFSIAARRGLGLIGDLGEKLAVSVGSVARFGAVGARASGALMGFSAGAAEAAALPWGWITVAAAAFGIFAYEVTKTNDATGQWIGQLDAWVGAASAGAVGATRLASAQANISIAMRGVNTQLGKGAAPIGYLTGAFRSLGGILATLVPGLGSLDGSLRTTTPHMTELQKQMNTVNWSAWQAGVAGSETVLGGLTQGLQMLAQSFGFARTPAQELLAEQQKLADQSALYHDRLGKLAVETGSVSNAQTLLTISGVTMKQMLDGSKTAWVQIEQAVNATIDAYRAMGQRSGILGADLNALNLAASDQVTQMGNLNAAWDKIIGIISGGQTSFITFQQDMLSVSQSLAQAGGSARIVTNTFPATASAIAKAAAKSGASMTGLNAASLQLRQTWQTAFTGGSSLIDALRMMTAIDPGAKSGSFPLLTRAMKDTLAELVPLGKTSAATRAEMVSLAQEINPNITNFQQLTKWIGNTKNPARDLNKILSGLGVNIQNLAKDASTLYAALQANIIQGFDKAKLASSGAAKQLSNLAYEVTHTGTAASKIHATEATLAKDFLKSGLNAQDAGTLILTMAGHINLAGQTSAQKHQSLMNLYEDFRRAGIGAQAAAKLVSILSGTLLKVPKNTTANVNADFTAAGVIDVKAQVAGKTWISHLVPAHGAAGMLVPGHGSGDTVPAMLTPGEAVVPKRLVRYVAPFLGAQKVPGFAAGGLVGVDQSISRLAPWSGQQESVWGGRTLSLFSDQVMAQFNAEMARAKAAARAAAARAAASGFGGGLGRAGLRYLENLWMGANGPGGGIAHIAAAIALAESGGKANAYNASGASGLWQILGQLVPGNIFDPHINALNAVAKYDTAYNGPNFTPWVTYTTGAYKAFMDHGGYLRPGMNHVWNGTGRLEKVSPPAPASQSLKLEFTGRRPGRPLESALWDWIVGNVRIKGAGDVQLALGTA